MIYIHLLVYTYDGVRMFFKYVLSHINYGLTKEINNMKYNYKSLIVPFTGIPWLGYRIG